MKDFSNPIVTTLFLRFRLVSGRNLLFFISRHYINISPDKSCTFRTEIEKPRQRNLSSSLIMQSVYGWVVQCEYHLTYFVRYYLTYFVGPTTGSGAASWLGEVWGRGGGILLAHKEWDHSEGAPLPHHPRCQTNHTQITLRQEYFSMYYSWFWICANDIQPDLIKTIFLHSYLILANYSGYIILTNHLRINS